MHRCDADGYRGTVADADAAGIYRETVMRFLALRLSSSDLRDKDIHKICGVTDYFLASMAKDLASAGKRRLARDGRVGRGGREPGTWSLCRTKELRLEAAMFIANWVVADQPFVLRQPEPALPRHVSHTQTVSLGVAEWVATMADGQALLDLADQRLYRAKHGGRNRVVGAD